MTKTMVGETPEPEHSDTKALIDSVLGDDTFRRLEMFHDRCDARLCEAQAFVLAVKGEQELVFCGHHGRKMMPALIGAGFYVADQQDQMTRPLYQGVDSNAAV